MWYGAQVWGYYESELVESVQKMFIKKLFRLPINTPNYVLYLETKTEQLYFYTLKVNLNYISKLYTYQQSRLPRALFNLITIKNVYISKFWRSFGQKYGINLDFNIEDSERIQSQLLKIEELARSRWWADLEGRARTAPKHQQLLTLDFDLGDRSFLCNGYDINTISWAIKVRAELVDLNFKPWIVGANYICSLCNLQENESVYHFVARCPILKCIRRRYLGVAVLEKESFQQYLNGKDWWALGKYMREAWEYRWKIIKEFNY